MPVSRTSIFHVTHLPGPPARSRRRRAGVNLIALESRFQTTCWSRSASPGNAGTGSTTCRSVMALACGGRPGTGQGRVDDRRKVHESDI